MLHELGQEKYILDHFREKVGEQVYTSGFQTIRIERLEKTVVATVPHVHLSWRLKEFYFTVLTQSVQIVWPEIGNIEVRVRRTDTPRKQPAQAEPKMRRSTTRTPPAPPLSRPHTKSADFSTEDWYAWIESLGVPITHRPHMKQIVRVVSSQLDTSEQEMCSRGRLQKIVFARQVAMYLARKHTTLSLASIGKKLGNRNHATIRHGVGRIQQLLDRNDECASSIVAKIEGILGV